MGLFTLQMQATGATITQLFGNPNLNSTFTITGGSLPLEFGETITGTHTGVDNNIDEYFGLNQGSVFMFMLNKDALVRYSVNGTLYVNQVFGSGTIELLGPIVSSADTISIDVRPITAYDIPTPALWYDSTDTTTLTLTGSGGNNYVTAWASKGSFSKTLTASTITTAPIYSGSSTLPGAPNVIRFTTDATAGNRDFLGSVHNSEFITTSGSTIFQVLTKPANATAMAAAFRLYSGNTAGGFIAPSTKLITNSTLALNGLNQSQVVGYPGPSNAFNITNATAYTKNNNYLLNNIAPVASGQFMKTYVNDFYSATTTAYVALTGGSQVNAILLNGLAAQTGAITAANSSNEVGEIIYYNRELTQSEIYIVQHYLQNKWGYDNW